MGQVYSDVGQYELNTTVGTTPEIDFRGFSKAVVYIPSGSSITSLAYHAAPVLGGDYEPLYDGDNAVAANTVAADRAVVLPAAIAPVAFLKIVVDNKETLSISLHSE